METILTPPTSTEKQKSTSQNQQETASRQISKSQIVELYKKPESEWTEEDVELLCRYNAQQQAIEKKMKEKKDRETEEQRNVSSLYWKKVKQLDRESENDGSIDWFMRQLTQKHGKPAPTFRLTEHEDIVPKYVENAYIMEVEKRGCKFDYDKNTMTIISTVSRWLTTHTKPGLMLRGYIGIGKTTMLLAIRDCISVLLNKKLHIVDARQIAAFGRDDGGDQLKQLAETPLLGIDDLGTEPTTVKSYGNEVSPVGELLTQRYQHQRFTIITTNLTTKKSECGIVDELQEVYGDRLYDRFKEMFNTLNYDPNQNSYRK
jgi:DNA replication protein DnaC